MAYGNAVSSSPYAFMHALVKAAQNMNQPGSPCTRHWMQVSESNACFSTYKS